MESIGMFGELSQGTEYIDVGEQVMQECSRWVARKEGRRRCQDRFVRVKVGDCVGAAKASAVVDWWPDTLRRAGGGARAAGVGAGRAQQSSF